MLIAFDESLDRQWFGGDNKMSFSRKAKFFFVNLKTNISKCKPVLKNHECLDLIMMMMIHDNDGGDDGSDENDSDK